MKIIILLILLNNLSSSINLKIETNSILNKEDKNDEICEKCLKKTIYSLNLSNNHSYNLSSTPSYKFSNSIQTKPSILLNNFFRFKTPPNFVFLSDNSSLSSIKKQTTTNRKKQLDELENKNIKSNEEENNFKNFVKKYNNFSSLPIRNRIYSINQINTVNYSFEDAKKATLEIAKIQKEGRCKIPSKRLISINKLLIDKMHSIKYLPHCTILYRCDAETGCCNSESETCKVKKKEQVKLPFWTIKLGDDGQQIKTIEWFNFDNHTECACG